MHKNCAKIQEDGLNARLDVALERGRRIRMLRVLSGLSRKQFQEQLSVSMSTLNIWENGRVCLTLKGAARISSAVKTIGVICSENWLLYGEGVPPYTAGSSAPTAEAPRTTEYRDEIDYFLHENKDGITTTITDDTMAPFYNIGDVVVGIPYKEDDLISLTGRPVILTINKTRAIRKLESIFDSVCHFSCCNSHTANDNLSYIRLEDGVSLAKIILHKSL